MNVKLSLFQTKKNSCEESARHKEISLPPAISCCWKNRLLLKMRIEKWSICSGCCWPFIWGCLVLSLSESYTSILPFQTATCSRLRFIREDYTCHLYSVLKDKMSSKDSETQGQSKLLLSIPLPLFTWFLKPHVGPVQTAYGNTHAADFPRHLATAVTIF